MRSLEVYFDDMAGHDVLSPEDEHAAAVRVRDAEAMHWVALLTHPTAARWVLPTLIEGVAELDVDGAPGLLRQLKRAGKQPATVELGRALRGVDSMRLLRTRALAIVAALGTQPDPTGDRPTVGGVEVPRVAPDAEWRAYQADCRRAWRDAERERAAFISANLRLVVSLAKRYRRTKLSLEDNIQEGNVGLMWAVDRFDPDRGVRFSTYAAWWIRHAITRATANKGDVVRHPVGVIATSSKLRRIKERHEARLGEAPTVEQLAEEAELPAAKVEAALEVSSAPALSLDRPLGDDEGRAFVDLVEDDNGIDIDAELDAEKQLAAIRDLLPMLTPLEAAIVQHSYGVDRPRLTLRELGDKYALGRERTREIHDRAIGWLRELAA